MPGRAPPLVRSLRRSLRAAGDPQRAPAMQAYMKSEMPFAGVSASARRQLFGAALVEHWPLDADEWKHAVLSLFRDARVREEWYLAMELYTAKRAQPHRRPATLPLLEELIVTSAWWDVVDHLAAHGLGDLLRRFPKRVEPKVRAWSRAKDPWKRRSAILSQLRFGDDTDRELLFDCIAPSLADRDFFLRKGIGWALRQLAWHDPDVVVRYVKDHENELSPLSRREALKNVEPKARRKKVRT